MGRGQLSSFLASWSGALDVSTSLEKPGGLEETGPLPWEPMQGELREISAYKSNFYSGKWLYNLKRVTLGKQPTPSFHLAHVQVSRWGASSWSRLRGA